MIESRLTSTQLTVNQVENHLVKAYEALSNNKIPFKKFPSVMLWGPPGVGKSQGVRHIAKSLTERTGKKVFVTDVRLLLFNPVDLRGIPTANADKTLAVWLKPKIFQMDDSDDIINILFLDEISAAPQSVQAAAYQITLDRTVGEHKLPENCIVIAAGNRVTDKSVAYNMPKALANRLCHIEVIGDSQSWHEWAAAAGIHPLVMGFISANPNMLMDFVPSKDNLAFPTPRSWEMVSNILNHVSDDFEIIRPLVSGCIGEEASYRLELWKETYDCSPDISGIFDGTMKGIPTRPEVVMAMMAQFGGYLKKHHSASEVDNALDYVFAMPIEYRGNALAYFLGVKEIRKQLQMDDRYCNWFLRSGRYWEDYI